MKLRPVEDRVIVEPEKEETSSGGIYIPETARERPQKGKVIAVGPGRLLDNGERVSPQVKPGDRVIFSKYGGTEVKIEGKEYIILREEDIYAIIEE